MFLHDFVKKGFLSAVGSMPDYWIQLNAAGYAEKGVLTEQDLAEIQNAIDEKNTPAPDASVAQEADGGTSADGA